MRISDWSSDVCSSDLWKPYGGHPYTPDEIAVPLISGAIALLGDPADQIIALRDHLADLYERLRPRHQGARKSVVSGQSVSVRVDLGGRRIINNKRQIITDTLFIDNKLYQQN